MHVAALGDELTRAAPMPRFPSQPFNLFSAARVAVVVAHPDDETIGAGASLRRLGRTGCRLTLVHVTDGAPQDLLDARRAGFAAAADYARARRIELAEALAIGGIGPYRAVALDIPDQQAVRFLPSVVDRLRGVIAEEQPDAVLTHAYEGGHPDHDAVSLAVRLAIATSTIGRCPALLELTSYHAVDGHLRTGEFLDNGAPPVEVCLTSDEFCLKRRMLDSFVTQRATLSWFSIAPERFRPAPQYDFTRPPHAGTLWYERFSWGVTGAEWRVLARDAARQLRRETCPCR